MAIVVDEYGTVAGVVSLENVLEQIVGPVEDEFDEEVPVLLETGPRTYTVRGGASLLVLNRRLGLDLNAPDVNTLSGLLTSKTGRLLEPGDTVELEGATVKVLETDGPRATRLELTLSPPEDPEED
jgi:CBS domain containing-hemolysin-like protein